MFVFHLICNCNYKFEHAVLVRISLYFHDWPMHTNCHQIWNMSTSIFGLKCSYVEGLNHIDFSCSLTKTFHTWLLLFIMSTSHRGLGSFDQSARPTIDPWGIDMVSRSMVAVNTTVIGLDPPHLVEICSSSDSMPLTQKRRWIGLLHSILSRTGWIQFKGW